MAKIIRTEVRIVVFDMVRNHDTGELEEKNHLILNQNHHQVIEEHTEQTLGYALDCAFDMVKETMTTKIIDKLKEIGFF